MHSSLRVALQQLGYETQSFEMLGGGMINQAARAQTSEESLFIKWNLKAPPALFACEAEGLRALAATQTVCVPHVLRVGQASETTPAFLLLEYIESKPPQPQFTRRFAEDLAALHQANAPLTFGWHGDNYLGELKQINTPCASWPQFYIERRLLPQIEMARQRKLLSGQREQLLHKAVEECEKLLSRFEARPCLIHGDLWSGNSISAGERAYLIDPAVYYGEREIEIAFVELFGGFPAGFVETYRQIFPLQEGYERRRVVHQLYPLLVHLNHFGETYGIPVENACRQILQS